MDTNPKTYLALGDSYTIGTFVEVNETFPAQTVNMMRELKKNSGSGYYCHYAGWTTKNLVNALNNQPPRHIYSIVSLLIGVNNQYQGKSLNQYKNEFADLLNRPFFTLVIIRKKFLYYPFLIIA